MRARILAALALLCLVTSSAWADVAIDAAGTASAAQTFATGMSYSGITVGSAANRAMVVGLLCDSGSSDPTVPTAVWDAAGANQSMALKTSKTGTNAGAGLPYCAEFVLRNPTSGNKTLTMTWDNSPDVCYVEAISFNGVNQASDAAAFVAATPTNGTGGSPSTLAIASSTHDYAVGAWASDSSNGSGPTTNQTSLLSAANGSGAAGMDRATTPAASISDQWTFSNTGATWAQCGLDVVAAPAAGAGAIIQGVP